MNLLLIPTAMERDRLISAINADGPRGAAWLRSHQVALCGFGLAASGVMAMRHLMLHRPERVILAGIAGSLDPRCKPATAGWFQDVICDGIGIGAAATFRSAADIGWNQLDANDDTIANGKPIGDHLPLVLPDAPSNAAVPWTLVTGCAGSDDPSSAELRRRRVQAWLSPNGEPPQTIVAAEDMEGFSVALACHVFGVPLAIVRGLSNGAGDRDHATWKTDDALRAVAKCLLDATFDTTFDATLGASNET